MYLKLKDNIVKEIISDIDENFPDIPINERFSQEFLNECMYISNDVMVDELWIYNPETGEFSEPLYTEPTIDNLPIEVYDQMKIDEIKTKLDEIDIATIRPLRSIYSGTENEYDKTKLVQLEEQAVLLRDQLAELESQ